MTTKVLPDVVIMKGSSGDAGEVVGVGVVGDAVGVTMEQSSDAAEYAIGVDVAACGVAASQYASRAASRAYHFRSGILSVGDRRWRPA